MTTTENGTEATTTPPVEATPPPGEVSPTKDNQSPPEPPEPAEEDKTAGNAEAARYRRRLREVETERDTTTALLSGYQRSAAERLAAEHLSRPGDLWLDGREVTDLLDDDGQVDAEKVKSEIDAVLDDRPQLAKGYNPRKADYGGGARPNLGGGSGWQDIVRSR